jgi:hypothetical protein
MHKNPMNFTSKHRDIFRNIPSLEKLYLGQVGINKKVFKAMMSNMNNLKVLHLDNIERLSAISNDMFQGLPQLTHLSLRRNSIRYIEANSLGHLSSLNSLDLSKNRLRFINRSMLAENLWTHLNVFYLSDNAFDCSCSLFWLLDSAKSKTTRVQFPDLLKSDCENDHGVLLEDVQLTPQQCLSKPYESGVIWNLAICSVAYVLVFIFSAVYHFRWPLRLKLFYLGNWWRMRQHNKRDDTVYGFDVFVCYNQSDSHWVRKALVPQLENHACEPRMKLCLYERDWLVGHDIVHCISESIAQSRKVLLVVTNAFAKSQWCHLEMTMAQHKVIDSDNDNVILAIMEDIEPINLNPRLALLMKRRTYLEWTEDADGQRLFWVKLKESLCADSRSLLRATPSNDEMVSLL